MPDEINLDDEPGVLRVLQTKGETKAFYDKIAKVYDLLAEQSERPMREAGLKLLAAARGERLLEIGFGTGHILAELADAVGPSGKVLGVDLSENMLAHAEKLLGSRGLMDRVSLNCGDAESLPYDGDSMERDIHVLHPGALRYSRYSQGPRGVQASSALGRAHRRGRCVQGRQGGLRPACLRVDAPPLSNLMDCRPIYARRAFEATGFVIDDLLTECMWVPVEIVRASKVHV